MISSCPTGWIPPPRALWNRQLAAFVRAVNAAARTAGPLTLTSWYRDRARNAACGGDRSSRHLEGLAVDVRAARPSAAAFAFRAAGLRVLNEGSHLHVSV